ncbi:MAG: hypothetical protein EBV16_11150, partial [Betaproteobacteria bacterium]|nr:hypothetical protein [Betaproteobacteria bacterium]
MKIAFLSDLHANIHALDACLEHAHSQGAERYALLGDLVGYGAFPSQVIERCMAHRATSTKWEIHKYKVTLPLFLGDVNPW